MAEGGDSSPARLRSPARRQHGQEPHALMGQDAPLATCGLCGAPQQTELAEEPLLIIATTKNKDLK